MGLPPEMCTELQAARICSPRFLFRAFSETSGGGDSRLNNETGVTPHLFLPDSKIAPHDSIEDFTALELTESLVNHLKTSRTPTEFSSWSFSVHTCLGYVEGQANAYLAVIDTKMLDRSVYAYHVPALQQVIDLATPEDEVWKLWDDLDELQEGFFKVFPHEFLIHGKVSGPGYFTMKLDSTATKDSSTSRSLQKFIEPGSSRGPLQPSEVYIVKEIAMKFGLQSDTRRELFVFLVVSFLAARVTAAKSEWYDVDVETILKGLQGLEATNVIPNIYAREDWIMLDIVDTSYSAEWSATILMLRALTFRQYGKRAIVQMRATRPQLEVVEAAEPKFSDLPLELTKLAKELIGSK
jgi:hypothetical protein